MHTDTCHPTATLLSDPEPHYSRIHFQVDHILTWKDCAVDKDQSYFLAETGATDVKIVIDFGCQVRMWSTLKWILL